MRFALVAGALVLGATVSDARSVAPSPSKRTTETLEFSTPTRNLKRARHDGGDWNPATESDDVPSNQDIIDPSAYQSQTPSAGNPIKKSRASSTLDGVNRTTLPDSLATTGDPNSTLSQALPQQIQYQIIPDSPGNSSGPDSPASDDRINLINPVSPTTTLAAVDPTEVTQTFDEDTTAPDLTAVVNHLKTQEGSKPSIALLRAIEKYRQDISREDLVDVNYAQSRSVTLNKPVNSTNSLVSPAVKGQTLSSSPLEGPLDSIAADAAGLPTNPPPLPHLIPTGSLDKSPLTNATDPGVVGSAPPDSDLAEVWDE